MAHNATAVTEATKAEEHDTEAKATGTDIAEVSTPLVGVTLTEEETAKAKAEEERAAIIAKRTEALAAIAKADTEEAKAEAIASAALLGDLFVNDRITEVRDNLLPALMADWRYSVSMAATLDSAGFNPAGIALAMRPTLTEAEAKDNTMRQRVGRMVRGARLWVLAGMPDTDARCEEIRAAGNRATEPLMSVYTAALTANAKASLTKAKAAYAKAEAEAVAAKAKAEAIAAAKAEAEAEAEASTEAEATGTEASAEETKADTEASTETEEEATKADTEAEAGTEAEATRQGPRSADGQPNRTETEERQRQPLAPNGPGAEAGVTLTADTVGTWPDSKAISALVLLLTEVSRRKSLSDAHRAEVRRAANLLAKSGAVAVRVLTPTEVAEAKAKAEADSKAKAEAEAKAKASTKATRTTRAAK